MKTVSTVLLIASGAAVLAAVWLPGSWWQWAITALVLLLAAAGTGGSAAKHHHPIDGPELMPEHVAREILTPDTTLEQIDEDVRAYKRSYGRKADR